MKPVEAIKAVLQKNDDLEKENALYKRILKQAILTQDGVLSINPAMADAAKNCNKELILTGNTVTIEGSGKSIFG